MTERQWDAVVRSGRQAEHQAVEIIRRPFASWERGTLARAAARARRRV